MRNALFIDGHWVPPARGRTFPVIDPATAQEIHSASAGRTEDINSRGVGI
jgi:acyl-CoA reductase-like NAD-dependent aldehyde dehydrogenase